MTNNDMIDRYLQAVKFWLPKAQQQDILNELAEDLHSQMEDREAALGHPLDEAGVAAILKQRGAPMRVASSYIPEQRLINPVMVPVYRLVLKIVLLWVLAPMFVVIYVGPLVTSRHPEQVLLSFWAQAWQTGFMVVGLVTVVFALFDRYHTKFKGLDNWDPRKLPRVAKAHETTAQCNYFASFIFSLAAAGCWAYLMWNRDGFDYPGGIHVTLGPVWKLVYWWILGQAVLGASVDFLAYMYACQARMRSMVRLGIDAGMLIVVALLYRMPALSFHGISSANMQWVESAISWMFGLIAVCSVIDAIQHVRFLLRKSPGADVGHALATYHR